MIAAIALANHMVLVTRNTKHFSTIQEVSGLQVENWFEGGLTNYGELDLSFNLMILRHIPFRDFFHGNWFWC